MMILTKRSIFLLMALVFCCCSIGVNTARIATSASSKNTAVDAVPAAAAEAQTAVESASSEEEDDDGDDEATGDAGVKEEEDEQADEDDDEDDALPTALTTGSGSDEKTAVEPADKTSSLSIWGMVRGVWNWLRSDFSESIFGLGGDATTVAEGGRTFGKIRRLQMALIPIIFKFGILSAMVAFLVLLGMKTLFLLKVLVLMNAAVILGKFLTFKTNFAQVEHHSAPTVWSSSSWSPHASHGWSSTGPAAPQPLPSKEIHLHIHGAQGQPQVSAYSSYGTGTQQHNGWERRSDNDPYAAYEPMQVVASESEVENELNNSGPIGLLPTRYPANHRSF